MKPAIPDASKFLASVFRDQIAPQLTGFHQGNAGMAAAMLDMIADEWDVYVERLVEENKTLNSLLKWGDELFPVHEPRALDIEVGLKVSALEAVNSNLRHKIITVQEQLETESDASSKDLEAAIWKALKESVETRRIQSANF